ncbi:MAG: D-tyrosyl-tRNA(Tyr) deacylase [Proteobacteria bacterium]|nr:D-tyrosyl-tRNA(Tyr) deacylase [Pseudomonadota bacterium]MBU1685736.1 D-tyrosyl-tRNA(Tyr) deacylase [Pseudomonadota bacterium]
MRAVIQRVSRSEVTVGGETTGAIGDGLLVLLGVSNRDGDKDADYLAEKIVHLRIFEDDQGKMNRSLLETEGEILVVSQFTLYGDCRKGRRPSYNDAAPPERAETLYEYFVMVLKEKGIPVATGRFQAMMAVNLINVGPVTILLDSEKRF